VRLEYGGTVTCAPEEGRPDRLCFVNQCLCSVDITKDPTLITILTASSSPGNDTHSSYSSEAVTDTSWYDPNNPDLWVPPPYMANEDTMSQCVGEGLL
jgi:hypothetical protein